MNWDGIISLLFFCIEAILLVNVLYFSRKDRYLWKGPLVIALLAGYQLMEYLMCGLEIKNSYAPLIAFIDISFLPPVGLLFVMDLLKKHLRYDKLLLLPPVVFIIIYIINVREFEVVKCTVLYAVYNYPYGDAFGVFYYLPVVITIFLLFSGLKKRQPMLRKNSKILLAGYLFVSVPVVTAFSFHFTGNSFLVDTIESVMCKSAIVLAVCYAFVILNITRKIQVEGSYT